MTITPDTTTVEIWNAGSLAGYRRGIEADHDAKRDLTHSGQPGEPPTDLHGDELEIWTDGFLAGFANGLRCSRRPT